MAISSYARFVPLGVLILSIIIAFFMHLTVKEMKHYSYHIEDQSGKVILITGANSGLGYHTVIHLARKGASVVMACRSLKKCEEAKLSIINRAPKCKNHLYTMELDLASFQSIRSFVKEVKRNWDHIDVLINNAGIMALPNREVTVDGLEAQIGTNHFGHFLLTNLLMNLIAKNGRIVNHSSSAHWFAKKNFVIDDVNSEKSYDPWTAYGNSKLANLLFTYELNRRLKGNPKNIISVALHPGYTNTNLQTDRFPFWRLANMLLAMDGDDGALSQVVGK
jgi:NAD(P)-dependent dehydrogenase (short-subunit alcohol dehydrogenase family)